MRDDKEVLVELRRILTGPTRQAFSRFLVSVAMGGYAGGASREVVAAATDLGLVTPPHLRPTKLGYLVADSLREHAFWIGRDRKLHFEGAGAFASASDFVGKRLLEVGCGVGCNLWSLAAAGVQAVGLEPQPLYVGIGEILCEVEGIAPPRVVIGQAERLPFSDAEFDIVLCVSAHQYMDLKLATAEFSRVLRPGGELLLIGGSLRSYLDVGLRPVLSGNPAALKEYAKTIANSLSYQLVGRRVVGHRAGASTAYPIYPTRKFMARALARNGMAPLRPISSIYPEICYSYRKD